MPVSNEILYDQLIAMSRDIGEINGKLDARGVLLAQLQQNDLRLSNQISQLQIDASRQRGFIGGVASLGGLIGGGIVILVEYLKNK